MRHERVVLMAFGSPLEKTATKERHDESAKLTDETRGSSSDRVARIERPESGRMRQQAAQIQEEAQAMKEASLLEKRAHEDMKRLTTIPSKTKKAAAAAKKDFTAAVDEALKTDVSSELSLESAKDAAKDTFGHEQAAVDALGAASASATGNTHTVRSGETLYRIGQKYHVGVDQLRKWNNLDNNTVVVGQKLIVSRP